MDIRRFLPRIAAAVAMGYVLFLLWMAAGIAAVVVFALVMHAGLRLAQDGDRPLEQWPILRRLLAG